MNVGEIADHTVDLAHDDAVVDEAERRRAIEEPRGTLAMVVRRIDQGDGDAQLMSSRRSIAGYSPGNSRDAYPLAIRRPQDAALTSRWSDNNHLDQMTNMFTGF